MKDMKVALVGNQATVRRIREMIGQEVLFMELEDYPCKWGELEPVLEEAQRNCDAVLFSGVRYFLHAGKSTAPKVPWGYPKRSTASVLCTLMKAYMAGADIRRITYDLHDMNTGKLVDLLCGEIGLPMDEVSVYCFNDAHRRQNDLSAVGWGAEYNAKASAYHLENLREGRVNFCLSASPGITDHELLADYPTFLVPLTQEDIRTALNDLRTQHQLRGRQADTGFRAAVLELSVQLSDVYNGEVQEFRQLHSVHQIEAEVFSFAQSVGGAVEKHGSGEYLLYTTRSELYAATEQLARLELAQRIQYLPDVEAVAVGIGFASMYSAAKSNAHYCVRCALKQKSNCYYVLEEGGLPSGPFLLKKSGSQQKMEELQLERIACETGVSPALLTRLMDSAAQYDLQTVTSDALAELCGMTVNNMNRVIGKLEQKGYAEVVGKRPNSGAGRPKRLIRLKLGPV